MDKLIDILILTLFCSPVFIAGILTLYKNSQMNITCPGTKRLHKFNNTGGWIAVSFSSLAWIVITIIVILR